MECTVLGKYYSTQIYIPILLPSENRYGTGVPLSQKLSDLNLGGGGWCGNAEDGCGHCLADLGQVLNHRLPDSTAPQFGNFLKAFLHLVWITLNHIPTAQLVGTYFRHNFHGNVS